MKKFFEEFETSLVIIIIMVLGAVLTLLKIDDKWSVPFIISGLVSIVIVIAEYTYMTEIRDDLIKGPDDPKPNINLDKKEKD